MKNDYSDIRIPGLTAKSNSTKQVPKLNLLSLGGPKIYSDA